MVDRISHRIRAVWRGSGRPLRARAALALGLLALACLSDEIVGPKAPLPALIAIDKRAVQFVMFQDGQFVSADTIRITNNGGGQLGAVSVDRPAVSWLSARVLAGRGDTTLVVLSVAAFADTVQRQADETTVSISAAGADRRTLRATRQTLEGARFEFSNSFVTFAFAPGDEGVIRRRISVRNGGNGVLTIREPVVRGAPWLALSRVSGTRDLAPTYELTAVIDDDLARNPRTYEGRIVFQSPATDSTRAKPDSIVVQLKVGAPRLGATTPALQFVSELTIPEPAEQVVKFSNVGDGTDDKLGALSIGTIEYGTGPKTNWLVSPVSQAEVKDRTVAFRASVAGLPPGRYTATVPVASASGDTMRIDVSFDVERPILEATSHAVSFAVVGRDGDPTGEAVALRNTGIGVLADLGAIRVDRITYAGTATGWLTADNSASKDTVRLTVNSTGLPNAVHRATVHLASDNGGTATIDVDFSVAKGAPPRLRAATDRAGLVGIIGDTSVVDAQTVALSNAGSGALADVGDISVTVRYLSGAQNWLSATLAGGTLTLRSTPSSITDAPVDAARDSATVRLTSTNGGAVVITVVFDQRAPKLRLTRRAFSFSTIAGAPAPVDTEKAVVINVGAGTRENLRVTTISPGYPVPDPENIRWLGYSLRGDSILVFVATTSKPDPNNPGQSIFIRPSNPTTPYQGLLLLSTQHGGSDTITVSFTVVSQPTPPSMALSAATVDFQAIRGDLTGLPQTVTVSNTGGGGVAALGNITAPAQPAPWLRTTVSGNVVTFTANPTGLTQTPVPVTVPISAPGATNTPQSVVVSFAIGQPRITVAPGAMSFTAVQGGAPQPTADTSTVDNTGVGLFSNLGTITVGPPTVPWIIATTSALKDSVFVTVNPAGLALGAHVGKVAVRGANANNGADDINVTLTITSSSSSPSIELSAGSVTLESVRGKPALQQEKVTVSNGGGGNLAALGTITVTVPAHTPTWLTHSYSAATGEITFTGNPVIIDDSKGPLAVTVASNIAGVATKTVNVSLTIGQPLLSIGPGAVAFTMEQTVLPTPNLQTLGLSNVGVGTFADMGTITPAAPSASWVTRTLGATTLDVALAAAATALTPGIQTATISVGVQHALNTPQVVDVAVAVKRPPTAPSIVLSAASVAFAAEDNANVTQNQTVSVSNGGGGALGALSVPANPVAWLTASAGAGSVTLTSNSSGLAVGTHTIVVPVSSVGASNSPQSITVTITIYDAPLPPALSLSAKTVDFVHVLAGASAPASRFLTSRNAGHGTLPPLTAPANPATWLTVNGSGTSQLELVPNPSGLPVGVVSVVVPVAAGGVAGSPQNVTVALTVFSGGAPTISLGENDVAFAAQIGGANPNPRTIDVSKIGVGAIGAATVPLNPAPWLTATTPVANTVVLTPSLSGLAPGVYTTTVPVTSTGAGNSPLSINVTFVVFRAPAAPTISLSHGSMSFQAIRGTTTPVTATLDVSNAGFGTLSALGTVTVTVPASNPQWLSRTYTAATGVITLTATPTGLTASPTVATVTVASNVAGVAPRTFTVAFTISQPAMTLTPGAVVFTSTLNQAGTSPSSHALAIANVGAGALGNLGVQPTCAPSNPALSCSIAAGVVTLSVNPAGRAVGNHVFTGTVTATNATNSPQPLRVVLSVLPPSTDPSINLSAGTVAFQAIRGDVVSLQSSLTVSNGGGGNLSALGTVTVTVPSHSPSWLSAGYNPGTGGVTLTANPTGLTATPAPVTVSVASNVAGVATRTFVVTFTISQPLLTLRPGTTSFTAVSGQAAATPATRTVQIDNTGAGLFANLGPVTSGAPSQAWVSSVAISGNIVTLSVNPAGLGVGGHSATIPISAPNANNGTQNITVNLTITNPATTPVISLSATAVTFKAVAPLTPPLTNTVSISNTGGGSLQNLTVTVPAHTPQWLTATRNGNNITLTAISTNLTNNNTYSASVVVSASNAAPVTLPVVMSTLDPRIVLSNAFVSFTASVGTQRIPTQHNLTVSNGGGGTYGDLGAITIVTSEPWIEVVHAPSPLTADDQLTIGVDATKMSGFGAGTFTGSVTLNTQSGSTATLTVAVEFRAAEQPKLTVSTTAVTFDLLRGVREGDQQSVRITNAGGGVLSNVTVFRRNPQGWLVDDFKNFVLSLTANTGTLARGDYSEDVEVSSNGGNATITVQLHVGVPILAASQPQVRFVTKEGSGDPAPQTIRLVNRGDGESSNVLPATITSVEYRNQGRATPWLTTALNGGDLRLSAVIEGLKPGTDTATVRLSGKAGGNAVFIVVMQLEPAVAEAIVSLVTDRLNFITVEGLESPPSQTATLANVGAGTLASIGTVSCGKPIYRRTGASWLTCTPAPSRVRIDVDAVSLGRGTDQALVPVLSSDGGTDTLTVNLTVRAPTLALSTEALIFGDTVRSAVPDTATVTIGNDGPGGRLALGTLKVGKITFDGGRGGWLRRPQVNDAIAGSELGVMVNAATLADSGTYGATVEVLGERPGRPTLSTTLRVTFHVVIPNSTFGAPSIGFFDAAGRVIQDHADTVTAGDTTLRLVRLKVGNPRNTRIILSRLSVEPPRYTQGASRTWISGAFLDRTTAPSGAPAELLVAIDPRGLARGTYEAQLTVASSLKLPLAPPNDAIPSQTLRLIVVVQ